MGLAELVLIVEALGRKLAPEPFIGGVTMGGSALGLWWRIGTARAWLPRVIDGSKVVALRIRKPRSRYDVFAIETRAEAPATVSIDR